MRKYLVAAAILAFSLPAYAAVKVLFKDRFETSTGGIEPLGPAWATDAPADDSDPTSIGKVAGHCFFETYDDNNRVAYHVFRPWGLEYNDGDELRLQADFRITDRPNLPTFGFFLGESALSWLANESVEVAVIDQYLGLISFDNVNDVVISNFDFDNTLNLMDGATYTLVLEAHAAPSGYTASVFAAGGSVPLLSTTIQQPLFHDLHVTGFRMLTDPPGDRFAGEIDDFQLTMED